MPSQDKAEGLNVAKLTKGQFSQKHGATGTLAVGDWNAPNRKVTNPAGKVVPTPYQLLVTILTNRLQGEWTVNAFMPVQPRRGTGKTGPKTIRPTVISIFISDPQDVRMLGNIFHLSKINNPPQHLSCATLYNFNYGQSEYHVFRKALGY